MNARRLLPILAGLGLLLLLMSRLAVRAAPDTLSLDWWTVDGGGGVASSGDYSLSGSVGQPDAGGLQGGEFKLEGGFWSGAPIEEQVSSKVFLPLIIVKP